MTTPHRSRASRAAAALAFLVAAPLASAQTLATDKGDYKPGETTYFVGAGFQPGELVVLSLKVENYTDTVLDYAIGGILVDGLGEFTATWLVPNEAADTLITATALGLSSGKVATTRFTDSVTPWGDLTLSADGNTVTVEMITSPTVGRYYWPRMIAALETSSGTYPLQLRYVSGGVRVVECWGSSWFGGGTSATWRGSREFPANTTVGLRNFRARIVYLDIPPLFLGDYDCFDAYSFVSVLFFPDDGPYQTVTTGSGTPCPTNSAPTLDLTPLDFGQVVGTFDGTNLTATVNVNELSFGPIAGDPDGDPRSVVFNGPSTFTFTGPGVAIGTVSFTVTDDPSARASSSCPLTPETTIVTTTVTVHVVYDFDGPLSPLAPGTTYLKKVGRTIPFKFTLRDATGLEVGPGNSTLFAAPDDVPELSVTAVTMNSPSGTPSVTDPGGANDNGPLFRYSGTTNVDGQWIYNLSTNAPGWSAGVLYRADVQLNDATTRSVFFTLKK